MTLKVHSATAGRQGKPTLADGIVALEQRTDLSPQKKRILKSALRRVAELIGKSPAHIVLDIAAIRKALESVNPIAAGISPKTYANLRSEFPKAVAEGGLLPGVLRPGWHRRPPLTPDWKLFEAALPDLRARAGLSRLMHYASNKGISPGQVNDRTVDAMMTEMHATSLRAAQHKVRRATARIWNEVVTRLSVKEKEDLK